MERENGELKIEILALSPMSRCGLPRPAMAFPRLMPTSGTLFMVCYEEDSIDNPVRGICPCLFNLIFYFVNSKHHHSISLISKLPNFQTISVLPIK